MESHMRIWYGIDTKLSEQETMQCCGNCGGGTNTNIYNYAKNGATFESGFKYAGKPLEECNTRRPRVPGSKVLNYYRIEQGADAVKNGMWHLVNVGPLATGLCVPGSFQHYRSGVYDEENNSNCGWHAVMVVGFGTENGKPYWLIRNSWGK
jgi:Papain family cysteine protease